MHPKLPTGGDAAGAARNGRATELEHAFPTADRRLLEKTRGRLLRQDDGLPAAPPAAENGLPLLTQAEWKAFMQKTTIKPLYIDTIIE